MSLQDLTRNVHNLEQLQMLHAVYQDDVDQMSELLQSGSDPNLVGSEGSPLLHVAVESGNEEMVQVLLSCGKLYHNKNTTLSQQLQNTTLSEQSQNTTLSEQL
jgi:ankyrin repeat protein